MLKTLIATALVATAAAAGVSATASAQSQRFPDVAADHYAFGAVEWAAEVGVTAGYGDGTFRPQVALTRAHALVFMERFYDEVLGAEASEGFTRADMMVLLKAINDGALRGGAAAGTASATASAQSQRFPDVAADHYAFEAVEWAAEVGVTAGYGDGTFRPQVALIKAHALVFMQRFYDEVLGAEASEGFTRADMMVLLKAINDGTDPQPAPTTTTTQPPGIWTPPRAGDVPTVHPDTPPTSWQRGDYEPGVRPFERLRTTGPDRAQVAEWIDWMGGDSASYTQWLIIAMKPALDYLGADPDCVIPQYYDRRITSEEVTPPNQPEPGHLRDLHGWHNCVTVIDPYITGIERPEDRENDIGLRLSDTAGVTLAQRCRAVLPEDIQLERYVGATKSYEPFQPGHAGCDEWAQWAESHYWFVNGGYPDCFRSARLAEEWMQHHHGQPRDFHRLIC